MSAEQSAGGATPVARRRLSRSEQALVALRVGKNETLADLVMDRVDKDFVRAMHVMSFIAAYGVFVEQNKREPRSVLELAATVKGKRSRATLDRWAQKFREAFPEYDMPSVLWASVRDQVMGEELFADLDSDVLTFQIGAATL